MKYIIFLAIGFAGLGFQGFSLRTIPGSQSRAYGGAKPESGPGDAKVKGNADNYYLLVFASQSDPPTARLSHSFACFVKAGGGADDHKILETKSISWSQPRTAPYSKMGTRTGNQCVSMGPV